MSIPRSLPWNQYTEQRLSRITHSLKRKRVELFVRLLGLRESDTVLDLGSEDGSYLAACYPWPKRITLADIEEAPMKRGVERHGLGGYVLISPDGALPIADRSFDAVWCNSVIEHVTLPRAELPGTRSRDFARRSDQHQAAFAAELRRVGRSYFVQTPYKHFPIEAHSWLPAVQYLPQPLRWRCSRWLQRYWIKQWRADFHLYDVARFRRHFPDASTIRIERFAGLPKSLIAVRAG